MSHVSYPVLEQILFGKAPNLVPLTVEQYHGMIREKILHDGDPIELIDGVLVRKDRSDRGGDPMSHGPRHALALKRLIRAARIVENHGCHLHSQLPITLPTSHEPEPDLAIVRGQPEDYVTRHPHPADILAVFEVADSSLDYDRTTKQRLYATAELKTYCIVNLHENLLEAYQEPRSSEGRYAVRDDYRAGQTLQLQVTESLLLEIRPAELLLPAP